ncbi:hypothetical protein PGTUg99_004016 [Puccinia graminis f. sp. tritici]|uniref:Rho GDP-dissociation inhibitor n=1 Tax=Puccinia graminis f. sp. tritici TaxID=56615 RepID=A0A5B0RA49_PUCGR|nr:hypothetical protein PGTUg99_004016 [Puccinia graminis f. sp. tritici]
MSSQVAQQGSHNPCFDLLLTIQLPTSPASISNPNRHPLKYITTTNQPTTSHPKPQAWLQPSVDDDDLKPSQTAGYNPGVAKTLEEYANLDAQDESLRKWKESLGIVPGGSTGKPTLSICSLSLHSPELSKPIVMDLTDPELLQKYKKEPLTIKEGAEYSVEIAFKVEGGVISGVKYLQVVKRAGVKLDKLESMIGSYGPSSDLHVKRFVSEEAPSGMLARSGSYTARSRVIDDDGTVWADFEWSFKIGKEW